MGTFDKSKIMVSNHVYMDANVLIHEMLQKQEYSEQLEPVLGLVNYKTVAIEAGYTVKEEQDGFYLISKDGEDGSFLTAYDAYEEACNLEGIEVEPLEFWVVSEMLKYQLEKRGEIVIDFFGITIWRRCATNNAIFTDDVMVVIAEHTNI